MKKTTSKAVRKKTAARAPKKPAASAVATPQGPGSVQVAETPAAPSEPKMPQTPGRPEQPGPAESASESNRGRTKKNTWWIQAAIAMVVVLVTVEVVVLLHSKISMQGRLQLMRVIGHRGGPPEEANRFWGPAQIRVDQTGQRVALTDSNFNKVLFWNTQTGELLAEVDKNGTHVVAANGQVQANDFQPFDGTFDPEGNFYAVDRQRGQVTIFTPEYRVAGVWTIPSAGSIAADREGNIYILDLASKNLVCYGADGQERRRFGGAELQAPSYMACDAEGNIYVVDRGAQRIKVFSPQGKLRASWKARFQPFGNPDIDVKNGRVYLSEHDNQKLFVHTPEGKVLWELSYPYPAVLAADEQGRVYVSGGDGIHQTEIVKAHP